MRAAERKKLPASAFAYPARRAFPIDTVKRARAALARAAQKRTNASYPVVARAVRKRHGDAIKSVGPTIGTTARPGYRKRKS